MGALTTQKAQEGQPPGKHIREKGHRPLSGNARGDHVKEKVQLSYIPRDQKKGNRDLPKLSTNRE